MALSHYDQIKHLFKEDLSDSDSKRLEAILSDVAHISRSNEYTRLKGRVRRKLVSCELHTDYHSDNDKIVELKEGAVLKIKIASRYTESKNPEGVMELKIVPTNYGVELRGEGPIFIDKSASNVAQVVSCDFREINEFINHD